MTTDSFSYLGFLGTFVGSFLGVLLGSLGAALIIKLTFRVLRESSPTLLNAYLTSLLVNIICLFFRYFNVLMSALSLSSLVKTLTWIEFILVFLVQIKTYMTVLRFRDNTKVLFRDSVILTTVIWLSSYLYLAILALFAGAKGLT